MVDALDTQQTRFVFGDFEFDARSGELFDGQKTQLLRPQVAKLLNLLLSHAGIIVSREEIRHCLWGTHTVVEFEEGISACMRQLRIALNDGTTGTRYIQTISRRGYKFVYPVSAADASRPVVKHEAAEHASQPQQSPPAASRGSRWQYPLAAGAILAVIIAALVFAYLRSPLEMFSRKPPARQIPVIAVLPFANLSTNSTNTVLGASIASDLIDLLGPVSPDRLGVIADTSTMHFVNSDKTIKTIGQELGASYVLEGSITENQGILSISARLIRSVDQSYVWGNNYNLDSKFQNTAFQQIIVQIANQVTGILDPEASIKPLEYTSNRQAALDYQLGRYLLVQGNADKAGDYCRHSMQLDPSFGAAYECSARSLLALPTISQVQVKTASELVNQALKLNANSSEAHLLQGVLDMFYRWNLTAAAGEIRQALRHNPGSAAAWQAQAAYYAAMGENQEMRQAMAMAQSLDPVSIRLSANSALLFFIDRQYDKAVQYAHTAVNLMPDDEFARHVLILALLGEGRYADASRQAVEEMRVSGATPAAIAQVTGGKQRALIRYFRWYTGANASQSSTDKLRAVFVADVYMHLGQPQQAFETLRNAVTQHAVSILIPFISVWPSLHPLCDDHQFLEMTQNLNQPGCTPNK
ncbi:MAG: winged helix-turn-helix domain-containing protein [Gammaproteobacteria bacterium]|nr:winged helix-turn-helix domain-containing protein [Gammaproteobacteria bacterium]MDE2346150.1 winged helix-turn-helix domain-containing protein [Gammaproteobacteria bacterium]